MLNAPSRSASLNARSLLLGAALCSPLSSQYCNVCRHPGALLRCDRCSRSYHLVCINLSEAQVPMGYWFCRRCWADYETKLNEDMDRLEKRQKSKKEKFVRKFMRHIQAVDVQKLVKKASKTRKRSHKEDRLDSLQGMEDLPQAEDPQPGEGVLSAVITVADFCYTFRDLLSLPVVSISALDCELRRTTDSAVLRRILTGGLRILLRQLFIRHATAECIPANCVYLSLAYQTHTMYHIADFVRDSYFPLLSELLTCPPWAAYVAPGSLISRVAEKKRLELPLEAYFYGSYSYQEKTEVLLWLTQCLLDCPEVADAVRKMTSMKVGLKVKLKELKKSKSDLSPQQKEETIAEMKEKIRALECVTRPFAYGNGSEMFHFAYDLRKICIRMLSGEDEKWQVFESKRDLAKLLVLESHQCKRRLKMIAKLAEAPATLEAASDSASSVLATIGKVLLTFEERLNLYLRSSQKQWETQEGVESWHRKVQSASSVHELKWLLLELAQKGNLAIKPRSAKSHYKKTIWSTPEFREQWESLLENVSGMQELLILTVFCAANWRHYAIKRETGERYFPFDLFSTERKSHSDTDLLRRPNNDDGSHTQTDGELTEKAETSSLEPMKVDAPGPSLLSEATALQVEPGGESRREESGSETGTEVQRERLATGEVKKRLRRIHNAEDDDDDYRPTNPKEALPKKQMKKLFVTQVRNFDTDTEPSVITRRRFSDLDAQIELKTLEGEQRSTERAAEGVEKAEEAKSTESLSSFQETVQSGPGRSPDRSPPPVESVSQTSEPNSSQSKSPGKKPEVIFLVQEVPYPAASSQDIHDNNSIPGRKGRKKRRSDAPEPPPRRSARLSKISKAS